MSNGLLSIRTFVSIVIPQLILFIIIFYSEMCFAQASRFVGMWKYESPIIKKGLPSISTSLYLKENPDHNLEGNYCFITQYGNRMDCGENGDLPNVQGIVSSSGNTVRVQFNPDFGDQFGEAALTRDGDKLIWNTIRQSGIVGFYAPDEIPFETSKTQPAYGERYVMVKKAHLYTTPSLRGQRNGYLVEKDVVKLLTATPDRRLWKISYIKKDGSEIERWISSEAFALSN